MGTNPEDYDVAKGLSSAAVGARSDGLVQIENAYVPGSHQAYVHRSHNGRYGLVNSEEGYQNLRRFLFGDQRVEAELVGHRLTEEDGVRWQAEAGLSIRGLPVMMHERAADHWCPILLSTPRTEAGDDDRVSLATAFLGSDLPRPGGATHLRYALHLRILSLRERNGILRFLDHLEQTADFDDTLIIDIGPHDGAVGTWAAWNSQVPGPIRDHEPTGTRSVTRTRQWAPGLRTSRCLRSRSRSLGLARGSACGLPRGADLRDNPFTEVELAIAACRDGSWSPRYARCVRYAQGAG